MKQKLAKIHPQLINRITRIRTFQFVKLEPEAKEDAGNPATAARTIPDSTTKRFRDFIIG
jgi:hypothetical protein